VDGTNGWRRAVAVAAVVAVALAGCSATTGTTAAPSTTATAGPAGTGTPGTTPTSGTAPTGGTTPTPASASSSGVGAVASWGQIAGTDGRQFIADGQGRARLFRGFNIKTRDPAKDASDELLAAGQARGFNLLRLSVYWDQFEPEKGKYDEAYLKAVGETLDRAAEHDILVIIDFHQDVFGPAFGDHGVPVWATRDDGLPYTKHEVWLQNYLEPAVQAAWEHLYEDADIRQAQMDSWTMIATRFGRHPAVLGYDLLNEPFGQFKPGEDLIAAATRVQAVQLTAMYQRLTDAIRTVDPDRWVFFEAPNVASLGIPVALGEVKGTKLAYFPHFYDPSIETATYAPGGVIDGFEPEFFTKYEKAITPYIEQHTYPALIGEWGLAHPDRPGMDDFVARSLALMDRIGSGWTVFNWCQGEGYCPIDAAGQDRPNIGQIVQPYARAIAGDPTSFVWDPKASTLTLVYADGDATGPTELVIPPSSYPKGWTVEVDGAPAQTAPDPADPLVVRVTTPANGSAHTVKLHPKP